MRIHPIFLLIVGSEGYGIRRGLIGIVQGLLSRKIPFHVAALEDGGTVEALRSLGVDVEIAPSVARPPVPVGLGAKAAVYVRRWAGQIALLSWLSRRLRRAGSPSLLFRSPPETLLAGLASRLAGCRAFWLMPAGINSKYPFGLNKTIYRNIIRHTSLVPIANSRYTASTLAPHIRFVSHLGIDPKEFRPVPLDRELRHSLNVPNDAVLLGLFARMTPEKGQTVLLNALSAIRAPNLHLLLCGGPTDNAFSEEVRRLVQRLEMGDRVHMLGAIKDVARYYAACDVVINSRLDPEPFGFSVIEAMMMGKPVLAHKAGGPGETVIDGVTGWHVDEPTEEGFRRGLERMLADKVNWSEMGAAANSHALRSFSMDAMVERLLSIMEEVHGSASREAVSAKGRALSGREG